jgi:formylglycine-generating enzyme
MERYSPAFSIAKKQRKKYKYDVAISVAVEDKDVAERIAVYFKEKGIRYFLYSEHRHKWGEHLLKIALDTYGAEARYILMITSKTFVKKYWVNIERQIAHIFSEGRKPHILQLRLDVTPVPGISREIIAEDWKNNPAEIANIIFEKLKQRDEFANNTEKGSELQFSLLLMILILISFFFFSQKGDEKKGKGEVPDKVEVAGNDIINDLSISRTEITVGEYRQYCLATKQSVPPGNFGEENCPIVNITYDEAEAYCRWLGGRLPTSIEWEHAASKNGNPSDRYSGADRASTVAQYSTEKPNPVAQKKPNALGIYDMTGNVSEWCNSDSAIEGKLFKIVKGGSYLSKIKPDPDSNQLRITYNDVADPTTRRPYIGFRVVFENKTY